MTVKLIAELANERLLTLEIAATLSGRDDQSTSVQKAAKFHLLSDVRAIELMREGGRTGQDEGKPCKNRELCE